MVQLRLNKYFKGYRMRYFIIFLLLILSNNSISQTKKRSRKVSNNSGTFFLSWGFNRSVYSQSNIYFSGANYGFKLANSKAQDDQSKLGSGDYALNSITIPQYNFKIGYYFKKKWSLSFGLDHMKYVFSDKNFVSITGNAIVSADQFVTFGNGQSFNNVTLNGQTLTTDRNDFHYSNSQGLNYIHLDLGYTKPFYSFGKKNDFIVSSVLGGGAGILLSYANILYNGVQSQNVESFSGYGLSGNAGLRFEMYKHFYVYSNLSAGFFHKVREKTSLVDPNSYVSQHFMYSQIEVGIGVFVFRRLKNKCDDCPVW